MNNEQLLVAVSGGADSVALLHMLRDSGVTAAHYNHGLRSEADSDEAFVAELCADWGVPLAVGRGDVAAEADKRGAGIEETARAMRYAFLEETRVSLGFGKIATAHNADDNAETVLLNLIRGAGTLGLTGIPPERGPIVRPILRLSRAEIAAYIREHNLRHIEDTSNRDPIYRRNFLRSEVIPLLKTLNPALTDAVTRLTGFLREDEEFLTSMAAEALKLHGRGSTFPAKFLLSMPKPVASRVCRLLVSALTGYPPELTGVDAMLDIAAGGNGRRRDLAGNLTAAKIRGRLVVTRKE
ncbi:MAG: tRNA lysidine(34) synthetase TilS [Oscillospiraceae bacterium]|jgi:tRNA(Ile)-lysidine synthase|nr:tRNA lysidine(34) synthetase TilS [Oscillospiraceae bacterium]